MIKKKNYLHYYLIVGCFLVLLIFARAFVNLPKWAVKVSFCDNRPPRYLKIKSDKELDNSDISENSFYGLQGVCGVETIGQVIREAN